MRLPPITVEKTIAAPRGSSLGGLPHGISSIGPSKGFAEASRAERVRPGDPDHALARARRLLDRDRSQKVIIEAGRRKDDKTGAGVVPRNGTVSPTPG